MATGKVGKVQLRRSKVATKIESTRNRSWDVCKHSPLCVKEQVKQNYGFCCLLTEFERLLWPRNAVNSPLIFSSVLTLTHSPEKFEHVKIKVDESAWHELMMLDSFPLS